MFYPCSSVLVEGEVHRPEGVGLSERGVQSGFVIVVYRALGSGEDLDVQDRRTPGIQNSDMPPFWSSLTKVSGDLNTIALGRGPRVIVDVCRELLVGERGAPETKNCFVRSAERNLGGATQ